MGDNIHSCKVQSPALLLQPFQDADGHLQDVGFLQPGLGLLLEAWTQETLELLNAAVDPLSAQLFHQRLSELPREEHNHEETHLGNRKERKDDIWRRFQILKEVYLVGENQKLL